MTDIVERMRLIDPTLELRYAEDVTKLHEIGLWCNEAADEIERLREMVKWFACNCEGACDRSANDCLISQAALGEKE